MLKCDYFRPTEAPEQHKGEEKNGEKSSFFAADTGSYDLLIFLYLPSTA